MKWLNNFSKKAFSLIELMIVLAIVAIMATLVSANSSLLLGLKTRSELDKLYAVCEYARHYAMASNQTQVITFDVASNLYTFLDREEKLSPGIRFGFIQGVKGPPSQPVALLSKPITFTHESITFYPDGIIQAGTIYLANSSNKSMYALSNAVSQVSYLRKYHYDGSWQVIS